MAEPENLYERWQRERTEMWADVNAEIRKDAGPAIGAVVMQVAEEIEAPRRWIETGLSPLDRLLDGGLRGGEVMIVAARPSVGKSAFALQAILHAAKRGERVGLWTIEMSPGQWVRRGVVALSGVPSRALRRGELTPEQSRAAGLALSSINALPVTFGGELTEPDRWAAQAAVMVEEGCTLLVIDYLQLMDPPSGAYNRENEVATISRKIKRTAVALDVPVMVLAQLNREAEGKPPTLRNLRESGALEQDPDVVFFLHRDYDDQRHVMSMTGMGIVAKNRDGEPGSFHITYDAQRFRFLPTVPPAVDTQHYPRKDVA